MRIESDPYTIYKLIAAKKDDLYGEEYYLMDSNGQLLTNSSTNVKIVYIYQESSQEWSDIQTRTVGLANHKFNSKQDHKDTIPYKISFLKELVKEISCIIEVVNKLPYFQ